MPWSTAWFIDAAPGPNGVHATFVRVEDKGLHLYRVALDGERIEQRQFAPALRLDKGSIAPWAA